MLSDLARKLYGEKYLTFFFPTITDALTTGLTIAKFVSPKNFRVTGISFYSLTQSSGVLKVELRDAAANILVSTGTSATGVGVSGLNANISKDDVVSVVAVGAASTDDYTGVSVVIKVEPLPTED